MAEPVKSYLDMSDEDLLNVDPSTLDQEAVVAEGGDPSTGTVPAEEKQEEEEVVDAQASEGTEAVADPEGQAEAEGDEQAGEIKEEKAPVVEPEGKKESTPKEETPEPTPESTEVAVDYEAAYKKLTAPFKANGREIQVTSVEDAVSLMQMGANYNKKMAALKPNLKLMKLLENNGLLNEEKLSYLIDLEKKNPDAIGKLLKDSGLDPLDLDTEKAAAYKPTQRTVDDREMELDTILEELHDSPAYNQTLDIVSNKWDVASKKVIADSPQILKVIDSHVQSGIYAMIAKEIENERLFGRLNGLSDIEAYRQVGDAIQARGGFSHLSTQGHQTPTAPVVVAPKPKIVDEDKRREKKLAASGSKAVTPSKSAAEYNPLSLSDDEFNKIVNQQFL